MKKEFEVEGVKYIVRTPSDLNIREGNKIYTKEFNKLLKDKDYHLKSELLKIAKDRGVWGDETDAEISVLQKEFQDLEKKTTKGGYEKKEAIEDALRMRDVRSELFAIEFGRNQWLSQSIESISDNKRGDYFVSVSILTEDGKYIASDVDDYLNRVNDDEVLKQGTTIYNEMMYGSLDGLFNTPEGKLLDQLGHVPEDIEDIKSLPFLENGEPIDSSVKTEEEEKLEEVVSS